MRGDVSPSKKRHLRRRTPSILLLWRPSFSFGALLVLLTISISLLLLRREIEALTSLPDDSDNGDWPITNFSMREVGGGGSSVSVLDELNGQTETKTGSTSESPPALVFEKEGRESVSGLENDGKGGGAGGGGGEAGRNLVLSQANGKGRESKTTDLTEEDKILARDVTLVISGKHSFATTEMQLEDILNSAPSVPILYAMSGPLTTSVKNFLVKMEKTIPHFQLLKTSNFTSGYSSRNLTLDHIKTKYALFIFNDVMPKNRKFLQELYTFAEKKPEGMVFAPFIWEKHRTGPHRGKDSAHFQSFATSQSEWDIRPHVGFTRDLTFDDFGNDGKLYIDLAEERLTADPSGLAAREVGSFLEDHCLLVRKEFLEESLIWDPPAGHTRQDVELALTLRYEKKKAFLVPQAEVIYQHPSLRLDPSDIPFFASQSSEDACAENLVHLRRKWGVVTGQLCRGFVDGVLRTVAWGEGDLPADFGEQLQMVVGMFALMGANRFQMRNFITWIPPPKGPALACRARHRKSCPRVLKWMESGSDAVSMLENLPLVEGALVELQAQLHAGLAPVNFSRGGPQLMMGRMEIQLPLRLNRVVDTTRAYALQSGDLFPVRRGLLKRGEKHGGRRAPDLPMLTRLYLPFVVVELELMLSKGGSRGIEAEDRLGRVMDGMSLVIKENCMRENDGNGGDAGALQRGFLLHPEGRVCHRNEEHYRAFMYIRHLETDPSPARMFMSFKHQLIKGTEVGVGGWVTGQSIRKGLAEPLQDTLQRLRVVVCLPGDSCSLSLPMGSMPRAWQLLLWVWRPQSVRTAQVLLLQPEVAKGSHRPS